MKNKRSSFADVGEQRWDKDICIFDLSYIQTFTYLNLQMIV